MRSTPAFNQMWGGRAISDQAGQGIGGTFIHICIKKNIMCIYVDFAIQFRLF